MFWTIVLSVLAALTALAYYFSTSKFNYWKNKNVPYIKPTPLLGNVGDLLLLKKYFGYVGQDICKQFPNEPYVGAFYGTEPTLYVQDPEYVKLITTKDFYYFNSRDLSEYDSKEPILSNVFSTYGDKWKVARQNLTPLFTTSKMKNMFYLIESCSHSFEKLIDQETSVSNEIDVRNFMARFTMACISSCVFGVDTHTLDGNQNYKANPFAMAGDELFQISKKNFYKFHFRAIWPEIFYRLKYKAMTKSMDKFFRDFVLSVFEGRNYKPTSRNDFVDFILNFKSKSHIVGDSITNAKNGGGKKVSVPVTEDLLVSHSLIFFSAGYETSATTLSFTMFELAKSPESLRRVEKEIDEYLLKHGNKLGYDCVTELPFTEACIDEALRLYPVVGVLTREVFEDYTLPTGVRLEKGLRVHLPAYHLHHNPEFFPEPEVFRPERFLGEEKRKIIPGTYIPFGDGPRLCIGMRFAKMQMLAGLVTVLKKYSLELAENTPRTVEVLPTAFVIQPKHPFIIKFKVREGWENRTFDQTKA